MGNFLGKVARRLFMYPLQRKPVCFFRQEDFSSTGEPLRKLYKSKKQEASEYDNLVNAFFKSLSEKRGITTQEQGEISEDNMTEVLDAYKGWDDLTIYNLRHVFELFCDSSNNALDLHNWRLVLESLGDDTPDAERCKKFEEMDEDQDGWIDQEEFLALIYNFHPSDGKKLQGVAKSCFEMAEKIRFVNSLTVGEQLEYGLF